MLKEESIASAVLTSEPRYFLGFGDFERSGADFSGCQSLFYL
jgi:hypothetical protein